MTTSIEDQVLSYGVYLNFSELFVCSFIIVACVVMYISHRSGRKFDDVIVGVASIAFFFACVIVPLPFSNLLKIMTAPSLYIQEQMIDVNLDRKLKELSQ